MDEPILTFALLNARLDERSVHPSLKVEVPTKRIVFIGGGFLAALGGTLASQFIPLHEAPRLVIAASSLVLELLGFVVGAFWRLPKLPRPARERQEFADQLDFEMANDQDVICWLSRFPKARLAAMRDYAGYRADLFRRRLPIMTGGLEKMGILPLAAALFVQLKNFSWPPHLSTIQWILSAGLVGLYIGGLLQLSVLFRSESYARFLSVALESADKAPA